MSNEELIERLRHFAEAYPIDVWPELSEEERERVGKNVISRISAGMGRHCSNIMGEAADALAEATTDIDCQDALISGQAKLLRHTVNILRGPPPDDTLWSHHDVPELAALISKHQAQLGTFVVLTIRTLEMLVNAGETMLSNMSAEDKLHERAQAEESAAAASDVPMAGVQEGTGPHAEGQSYMDTLFRRRSHAAMDSAQRKSADTPDDLPGSEAASND